MYVVHCHDAHLMHLMYYICNHAIPNPFDWRCFCLSACLPKRKTLLDDWAVATLQRRRSSCMSLTTRLRDDDVRFSPRS